MFRAKLKEEKRHVEYLTPQATFEILAACNSKTGKYRRNRMMLILLYDSGARVQELSNLNMSFLHMDAPNPYMTLVGKGRKCGNMPLMVKTLNLALKKAADIARETCRDMFQICLPPPHKENKGNGSL